jgi:hypothetical protein
VPRLLGASVRLALFGVLFVLWSSASALAASPPTAGNDSLQASPTGALDVLGNDTGTDVKVSQTGSPTHGTASCKPLGGCLYKADKGYTGADAFTYTIKDADGAEATGTVTVSVSESPAGNALIAADDDVATLSGKPVTLRLLDNDTGTAPLTVASHTDPTHGTLSCTSDDGVCTYTPEAGFTGSDGFRYTADDAGTQPASSADVHILVAPADASYGLGVHGGPGSITDGDKAAWSAGVGSPSSLQELAALPLPELTSNLSGPQHVEGTPQGAKGWTVSADGTKASAGDGALLGSAVSEAFPRPLPPLSTGTGGDGHVPILVGSKVVTFFHHSQPTRVSCLDRRTGTACPGYPISLEMGTTNINGPGVVIGTKIYTHLFPLNYGTPSGPLGLFCWDTSTNSTCGYFVLARMSGNPVPGASAPVMVGSKIYMAGDGGKLFCLDPATGDPCGSMDSGLAPGPGGEYDIITHGTRVYASRLSGTAACIDVATGSACPGWETPKNTGPAWNLVNMHDATGAITGVCAFSASTGDCYPDADPSTSTHVTTFPTTDPYYSVTEEAEAGTRTFVGSLSHYGVGCWDWSTMKPCAGPNFGPDGWTTTVSGADAYGARWDGSCVVALGDRGLAFTVDFDGASPCTSLSSGTNKRSIDLRDQRFDRSVGSAHWNKVVLTDTKPGELDSVNVSVRDAETGDLIKSGDVAGGDHTLDLSGIDPQRHPAVTLDATSTEANQQQSPPIDVETARSVASAAAASSPWDDGIPPRLVLSWTADPKQVGFTTRSTSGCSTAADTTLGVATHLAGGADKLAQVGLTRSASCTVAPPAAAPVAAAAVPRICGGARLFSIHVRYKGSQIKKLTVTVNGKRQKIKSMKGRPVVRVDLRKLTRGTVKVKITIKTKAGKTLKGTRVYHPCTKKLPDRGFKY